jgi:hypothetical protein
VNSLVLSGAPTFVLSGARPSCYQAHERAANPRQATICERRNVSNLNYLTINRGPLLWISALSAGATP